MIRGGGATETCDLADAAYWLGEALASTDDGDRSDFCARAAALLRRHRKALAETAPRSTGWYTVTDEQLLWKALGCTAAAGHKDVGSGGHRSVAHWCREAEAALRTLWRRQQEPKNRPADLPRCLCGAAPLPSRRQPVRPPRSAS